MFNKLNDRSTQSKSRPCHERWLREELRPPGGSRSSRHGTSRAAGGKILNQEVEDHPDGRGSSTRGGMATGPSRRRPGTHSLPEGEDDSPGSDSLHPPEGGSLHRRQGSGSHTTRLQGSSTTRAPAGGPPTHPGGPGGGEWRDDLPSGMEQPHGRREARPRGGHRRPPGRRLEHPDGRRGVPAGTRARLSPRA
ncbi:hypothetical protein GCM10014719_51870 [Planomonospora parontospora subsp. antibiotica]|nr:hypothetical protein GCM10014719_51870 [Planomonospora parontospora subsp. antibiotica]GII18584.1 hypothetical protein Ppa05_53100 [Planomonospora parontospora subsp. antibiotica]